MTLGERIKKVRKDKDLTQQLFAAKIGTTANVLTNYETGRRNPSSSVINNICKTFNVDETWLRTGEGKMFVELPQNEALAEQIRKFLQGGTDSFRERLISLLIRLEPEQWEALEGYLMELVNGQERTVVDISGQEQMEAEKKSRIAVERKAGQEEMDAAEELLPEEQEKLDSYRREMIAKRGQTGQQSALPNANAS